MISHAMIIQAPVTEMKEPFIFLCGGAVGLACERRRISGCRDSLRRKFSAERISTAGNTSAVAGYGGVGKWNFRGGGG